MLLNAENLKNIKYKTKRVRLQKAEADIIVALLPVSLIRQAKDNIDGADDFGYQILKQSVIDDKGNPVFENKDDFESLPLAVQKEIMDAIYEHNGLTDTAQQAIEKN